MNWLHLLSIGLGLVALAVICGLAAAAAIMFFDDRNIP